jgi:hypothetical protein
MAQERNNEQHQENVEQDFGNTRRSYGHAAKTQESGNQSNHEESEGPSKHYDLQHESVTLRK